MTPPPGWEGILDPDETILWQGRPDPALAVDPRRIPQAVFGLLFTTIAVSWMTLAAQAGGYLWTFGLIHFSAGMGILAHALVWPTYRRRRSWYTLSTRRAFIATAFPLVGRQLKSYPITADTVLTFADGDLASIGFAYEPGRTRRRMRMRTIGFERLADGRMVYALMRGIQTDSRTAALPGDTAR